MEERESMRAEATHETYDHQVANVNATKVEELWDGIIAAASGAQGGSGPRVMREGRSLILSEPVSERTLRFEVDEVTDLPEAERPGPFAMGNARVRMTAWNGVAREWLLRNVAAGGIEYRWVTLPGDVVIDEHILAALVAGLGRGDLPPDPGETVHRDPAAAENGVLSAGERWGIHNLYSGERRPQVFDSGTQAGDALKELVRAGELDEGDWEVRTIADDGR